MMDFFASLYGYGDWGLLVLRLAVAAIFLVHGKAKFAYWKPGAQTQMPGMMKFLSIAETAGGLAMLFGFLSQLAAVGLGIVMLGAIKMKIFNWQLPFADTAKNGWEFDIIILAACITLFFFGPGALSLDRLWFGL